MVTKRHPLVSFINFLKVRKGDFQMPLVKSQKRHSNDSRKALTKLQKRHSKKAQLKIQQMAFMLLAVTLFFVLVGIFIIVFRYAGIKETATALEEENAMLLATKLANSPEFSCGLAFEGSRVLCIDADKAMVLRENIAKYEDFWGRGVSNIEIVKVYPTGNTICTQSNYPDCEIIPIISKETSGTSIWSFVSLCRKERYEGESYSKCELAKIFVSYEEAE